MVVHGSMVCLFVCAVWAGRVYAHSRSDLHGNLNDLSGSLKSARSESPLMLAVPVRSFVAVL